MEYKVGGKNRSNHFLDFEISVACEKEKTLQLMLPKWRPGRYEMGNFAKNIRAFSVVDEKGKPIHFQKSASHTWDIESSNAKNITVRYQVYAHEINAGSTYTDEDQVYINPINCCLYHPSKMDQKHLIEFDLPQDYVFATSLKQNQKLKYEAANYDELADSPIIASKNLKHGSFNVGKIDFHLWFQGECQPNWKKLIPDFTAFAKKQIEDFGSAPFNSFHFLFQITPQASYHGVEHQHSTVITLGPGFQIMEEELYQELLGVSSHELYHAWNVKCIRPAEMVPYDYQNENYTELGYVTEGFTTYFGDLYLSKSKLADEKMWFNLLHKLLDRHSLNYGRFNYAVTESSFDTWLDGYVKGIPNRKTSIYVEGALLALALDLEILKRTKGQHCLANLQKDLYLNFGLKNKGIVENDLLKGLKKLTNVDFSGFFEKNYHTAGDLFSLIKGQLNSVGLSLEKQNHEYFGASQLGMLIDSNDKIGFLAPDSPAELSGLAVGDKIIAINNLPCKNNSNSWIDYFKEDLDTLLVDRGNQIKSFTLKKSKGNYFEKYRIKKINKPSAEQKKMYALWCL